MVALVGRPAADERADEATTPAVARRAGAARGELQEQMITEVPRRANSRLVFIG
jgi:hypothetical protein